MSWLARTLKLTPVMRSLALSADRDIIEQGNGNGWPGVSMGDWAGCMTSRLDFRGDSTYCGSSFTHSVISLSSKMI